VLEGALPEEVKLARRERLLAVQQEVAFAWGQAQVGRRMEVMIDYVLSEETGDGPHSCEDHPSVAPAGELHPPAEKGAASGQALVGRTYADAPEVDGVVYVTGENLAPGQVVPCEIVAARGYDLVAVSDQLSAISKAES
jgi:ribosomal protein S12 methylthiotransferase